MGKAITFAQVDEASRALAAYLQALGLAKGDRVAIMMPNVPQYPVAVAAILRAGYVVVNVNPLYTPRELEHQLKDSGAKAIVMVENFATTLQQVMASGADQEGHRHRAGRHAGLPEVADRQLRGAQGEEDGAGLRAARRRAASTTRWRRAAARPSSRRRSGPDDIAVLQYTGGTTGVSKGAVLLHRNLVANILQAEAWYQPALKKIPPGEQINTVCALPIYHIFGFNTNMMLAMRMGGCNILIANPRDLPGGVQGAGRAQKFHSFPAVNTLFNAMAQPRRLRHGGLERPGDLGRRRHGGAKRHRQAVAREDRLPDRRGLRPVRDLARRPPATRWTAPPTAATSACRCPTPSSTLLDDDGNEVPLGTPGEIAIRGPQVMAGYWQRPDETAKVMTADGFFRTGDIGVVDERGYFKIVDRKKDMILVSGFNVYPNEVEDVVTQMPGILECAAVGIADAKAGEAVKLVIVKKQPGRHRGRRARLLRGAPDRLQAAEGRRVPHRAAEDAGRQDPAPGAARQELSARRAGRPACDTDRMSRIAIVSAMHEELRALLPSLQKPQRAEFAGRVFHFGQMHGQPVVMVLSGIGKVAAATTAALLLQRSRTCSASCSPARPAASGPACAWATW